MKRKLTPCTWAAVWATTPLVLAAPAMAAETLDLSQPSVSLRAFGTVGLTHSDARNADFVHGFFEPNGAGETRRWALGVDTKAGVQVDAKLTNNLSAVVQVVSQHRYDNTYTPQLEWANLKYQVTPDFDVRVGRTVNAPFMVSESRLVGYSNVWVRPPQEVYGLVPITNKDGFDATYRLHIREITNSMHASYGRTSLKLPANGRVKAEDYFEFANTVESGPISVRLSYSTGRVTLHTPALDALTEGFTAFGSTMNALGLNGAAGQAFDVANRYRFEHAPISVFAVGANYDRDRWLAMAEWAHFDGHSVLANSTAWYATIGYRVRQFTPYATAARLHAEQRSETGIATAGMPPPLATSAATLNAGLASLLAGARFAQSSVSAGVRWDFYRNAALKLQYDRVRPEGGSSGRLGAVSPAYPGGGKVNVFSIAVDFVF